MDVHEKIYQGMLELQDESWPMIQGLGRLFMKYAPTFQNYQVYAENYKTSEATLDKVLSQRKSKLREVIEVSLLLPRGFLDENDPLRTPRDGYSRARGAVND